MESEKLIPMRLGLSTDLAPKPSHQGAPDMDFIINSAGISTITDPDEDSAIFNLDMKSLSIYPVSCTLYMTQAFATVCSGPTAAAFAKGKAIASPAAPTCTASVRLVYTNAPLSNQQTKTAATE